MTTALLLLAAFALLNAARLAWAGAAMTARPVSKPFRLQRVRVASITVSF